MDEKRDPKRAGARHRHISIPIYDGEGHPVKGGAPLRITLGEDARLRRLSEWLTRSSPFLVARMSHATRAALMRGLQEFEREMEAETSTPKNGGRRGR